MTLRKLLSPIVLLFLLRSGAALAAGYDGVYTSLVDPFIGTGAVEGGLSGNTFPGATMPFGMVQLSPDTQDAPDWDNASGYNYNHNTIYGFSHTRLSGTGACDFLDVLLLPLTADGEGQPVEHFSHADESASPGYYRVRLADSGVEAELSATTRVGLHRYTYPDGARQRLFLDLDHSAPKGSWDRRVIQSQIRIVSPTRVEGYRIITGWAKLRRVYFSMELSKPISSYILADGSRLVASGYVINGRALRAFFDFDTDSGRCITAKVGLSTTSVANARLNMDAEAQNWDFDAYSDQAGKAWDNILGRIEVEGSDTDKKMFYTALYHVMTQPNVISDVNGDYTATDYTTRRMPKGEDYYSTFSLWDTFRGVHPLLTIIDPEADAAFVRSMLRHADTYGYLPIWDLWGQDNYCMIGNHAVPVVVDACLKGLLPEADAQRALDAVVQSCTVSHPGLDVEAWEHHGYMPEDVLSQSVSITLEQSFDDWCVALLAKRMGKDDIAERFTRRAGFFRNLFNSANGFFQARNADGEWLEPFDPLQYGANGGNPYTEGNAWQYSWYVPHDIPTLIDLNGGKEAFVKKLDTFFSLNEQSGELNSNASGFIGQYIHGNEPGHHVAYLYGYAGKPRRTQEYVHRIIREMYNIGSSGYAGNDDCGEMSAWLVFSALGFYPVNPVGGEMAIGTPLFSSATIHLPGGKKFVIKAPGKSDDAFYVKKVTLDGKDIKGNTITYDDIVSDGELVFTMSKK